MTTSVSTAAVSQSLRYNLMRAQAELVNANKEAQTITVADRGLALGARTSQSISLSRDLERLNGIIDQNELISSRLTGTQNALQQLQDRAQTLMSTLSAGISGDASADVMLTDAKGTLDALTSILNTSINGEHIFAGINTDVSPIGAYTAGSPAKAAFDASFQAFFTFPQSDPQAANITTAQMNTFLDTVVTPQFMGAGWQTNWSDGSDEPITSRISLNETIETSVSANGEGIRKLAMVASSVFDLLSAPDMSQAAKSALLEKAVGIVGEAIGDLATLQAETGITQQRVSKATERMEMQADIFERTVGKMEAVDPYEASTRVTALMDMIEASYALTARLQQLSLTKFL